MNDSSTEGKDCKQNIPFVGFPTLQKTKLHQMTKPQPSINRDRRGLASPGNPYPPKTVVGQKSLVRQTSELTLSTKATTSTRSTLGTFSSNGSDNSGSRGSKSSISIPRSSHGVLQRSKMEPQLKTQKVTTSTTKSISPQRQTRGTVTQMKNQHHVPHNKITRTALKREGGNRQKAQGGTQPSKPIVRQHVSRKIELQTRSNEFHIADLKTSRESLGGSDSSLSLSDIPKTSRGSMGDMHSDGSIGILRKGRFFSSEVASRSNSSHVSIQTNKREVFKMNGRARSAESLRLGAFDNTNFVTSRAPSPLLSNCNRKGGAHTSSTIGGQFGRDPKFKINERVSRPQRVIQTGTSSSCTMHDRASNNDKRANRVTFASNTKARKTPMVIDHKQVRPRSVSIDDHTTPRWQYNGTEQGLGKLRIKDNHRTSSGIRAPVVTRKTVYKVTRKGAEYSCKSLPKNEAIKFDPRSRHTQNGNDLKARIEDEIFNRRMGTQTRGAQLWHQVTEKIEADKIKAVKSSPVCEGKSFIKLFKPQHGKTETKHNTTDGGNQLSHNEMRLAAATAAFYSMEQQL